MPGPSSSCVPWSSTPPGATAPRPLSVRSPSSSGEVKPWTPGKTNHFVATYPRPTRSRAYASPNPLPSPAQGSLPARAGSPLAGRVSHPLDDKTRFHEVIAYSIPPRPALPGRTTSSFQERDLPTWTLRLLSQVRGVREGQIPSLLVNTFGGYTASRSNPQWISRVEAEVSALVGRLLQAGLAEREGDLIHLTLLGRACGSSSLSFESGLRLIELMRTLDPAQTEPLLVLGIVQVLSEMDAIYTPVQKRGRSESCRPSEATQRFGHSLVHGLQRYCRDEFEFWARCKRASLLYDWIEGTPVDELERRYSTTPFGGAISYGDIIRIADGARFHMRSAHQILSTLFPDHPIFLSGLDKLLNRLEFGLPAEALPLTGISLPLTRGQFLALFASGCATVEDATNLTVEKLAACIGVDGASLLRPKPDPVEQVA